MRQRLVRRAAAGALALGAALATWLPAAAPAGAAQATARPGSVQLEVTSVTPNSPLSTTKPAPLTVQLKLTNTTGATFHRLTITGVRGDPIDHESALAAAIAKPALPAASDTLTADITTQHPVRTSLGPHESTTVEFVTSTSTIDGTAGVCLCQNKIYPLHFMVTATPKNAGPVVLDSAETFLPSFGDTAHAPEPVQVSWVWPILDRPHRSTSDTVFTDDELATSVAGGRLYRLLETVQDVVAADPNLAMTLLVDPDLIDELAVMAAGTYTVQVSATKTTAGTGTAAAAAWLGGLRAVLSTDPSLQLAFTPYADPDVRSLAAHELTWTQDSSEAAQARIAAAVGDHPADTNISWPAGSSLDAKTLRALIRSGVSTVLVDSRSVPGSARQATPASLAPVSTSAGRATLAVAPIAIERSASQVISVDGTGLAGLPQLVARVAVSAVQDGNHSHYLVITPSRLADPDPVTASQAILQTAGSGTGWSQSLSLGTAVDTVTPVKQGALHARTYSHALPDRTIAAAQYLATTLPSATSLLTDPAHPDEPAAGATPSTPATTPSSAASTPDGSGGADAGSTDASGTGGNGTGTAAIDAAELLGGLPVGMQRAESTEWVRTPAAGAKGATAIRNTVRTLVGGVHLIKPTKGTYTLGSSDSPLPITIDNTLSANVYVRLRLSAAGGLPGFEPGDVGVEKVAPHSRLAVHVPVHFDRPGRLKVQVMLTTPGDQPIGPDLVLSVRSTALGYIGKIITYVAGAILAAALLLRAGRRLVRRRRRHGTGSDTGTATATGAETGAGAEAPQ